MALATPFQPVKASSAWTAGDMKARQTEWTHALTPSEVQELGYASDNALASHVPTHLINANDFPLPNLGPRLKRILDSDVQEGRGFAVITGLPVLEWSREKVVVSYWIMGQYWGHAVSNNKKGHLVGHIKDLGHDVTDPNTRLYATTAPQPFHNDASDVVSLLCLNNAPSGGLSSWSSSIAIHNKIVTGAPELAQLLAAENEWFFDRKGEVPNGKEPYMMIPVFNYHQGRLFINWSSNYYFSSQRHEKIKDFLTPAHLEAIKMVDGLAACDEFRMDYLLQPGDIQLLNNHTIFHSRGGFIDDPQRPRHLLRLWLAPNNAPPLPECYREILGGSLEPGKRGGIAVEGTELHITFEAE